MEKKIWINQEAQSNKFWEYEVQSEDPYRVLVKWGRLSLTGQSQTKCFKNEAAMRAFLCKKIFEKERKGYKNIQENERKKEVDIARELGYQNKISKIQYVTKRDGRLDILNDYNPEQYVYVEVLNSWDKTVQHFVLSKNESYRIDSVTEQGHSILFDEIQEITSRFISTIRKVLRKIAKQVTTIVTQKIAALGKRKFILGDTATASEGDRFLGVGVGVGVEICKEANISSSVSAQAVSKFAVLGARKLML
jgi:predicted DNA-binding WGR domain protein